MNIYVMTVLNYIRISLHFYNTKEEINRFINILTNIVKERV